MELQEDAAEPAGSPPRGGTPTGRRVLVSALGLGLGRTLSVLWSVLCVSPLGSRRVLAWFSSRRQIQDGTASPQLGESAFRQNKVWLHSWFRSLLLLSLLLFVLCCSLVTRSLSWWETFPLHVHYQRFLHQNGQFHRPPPFLVHRRNQTVKPTEIYQTTTHLTVPTVAPTAPTAPTDTHFHHADPRNYHFIMDNEEACRNKTPFLVLMVPVAPGNKAARDAIRQTWANESLVQGKVTLTLFMLGLSGGADMERKLKEENLQHHDLIQSDFLDTYLNLTTKTMVIMDWLAKRCPTAQYAMKVDSDMFLNIDNLVLMLQKPGVPKENYLTGMLMWNRPVVRSKNSKWYVSEEMYPEPRYPTYTLGMGYVFSNDLPRRFVEISQSIKPFNIEDAYIGMCMKKLGLAPKSPPDPSQFRAYNTKYNRCEYSKIITYILGSSKELLRYWKDLKKPGPPCEGP